MAGDLKTQSKTESELLIKEARIKAERLLEQALCEQLQCEPDQLGI